MMIGFMLNAQSLREKGDAIYDKGESDSAAEMYSQCMKTDDNCLLKYTDLVLRKNVESEMLNELFSLLSSLAEKDDPEAQFYLGEMYSYGDGVTIDYTEAIKWFQKSDGKYESESLYKLGFMYEKGCGVAKNNSEAMKWYQKAAEQGNEFAKKALERLSGIL